MTVVGHLGLEHPNLAWILASALIAFGLGLGLNLRRSLGDDSADDEVLAEDAS